MTNKIDNWTYEKPTEEGLYLITERSTNNPDEIIFLRVSNIYKSWHRSATVSLEEARNMDSKWQFARLCVGSECDE